MNRIRYVAAFGFLAGSAIFAAQYDWAPATWLGVWALILLHLAED